MKENIDGGTLSIAVAQFHPTESCWSVVSESACTVASFIEKLIIRITKS